MSSSNNERGRSAASRRSLLKAGGASAVALGLAGCSGDSGGNETTTGGTGGGTGTTRSGPETVQEKDVPSGGTFTLGLNTKPKPMNPLSVSSAYSWVMMDFVYQAGTFLDPVTFDMRPWVFSDWTIENADSPDSKPDVYVTVRDDLTWTDGKKVTVDDVVFTYNYMLEQQPGRYLSALDPIQSAEKAGDGKWDVHLKLKKPVGTYRYRQLGLPLLPKHVWSSVDDYKTYRPTQEDGPVGIGPGTVTKFDQATAVEVSFEGDDFPLTNQQWMKDHPNLRAGGPFLDAVRYRIFGSDAALQKAFLRNDIDSVYQMIKSSHVEQVKKNEGQRLVNGYDTGYNYYGFNLRRAPLDDATFRQAMAMAFDDYYWVTRLYSGLQIEGDFVIPPGYRAARPETGSTDARLYKDPATNVFQFRGKDGQVQVDQIRQFLTKGRVVDGSAGTYAGFDYPGSLTGVRASQQQANHEYSFGPVQSQVLQGNDGPDKEIRVDGKTIPQLMDGPIELLIFPAKETPKLAKMSSRWVTTLKKVGVPVKQKVLSFNSALTQVYVKENFDVYPMAWGNTSPFAVGSLYNVFHSDNADDHSQTGEFEQKNAQTSLNNAMGYGLGKTGADGLISKARTEVNQQQRNQLARKAVEKVYLDMPYMVVGYDKLRWPVDSKNFGGFVGSIPGPGSANFWKNGLQIHQTK